MNSISTYSIHDPQIKAAEGVYYRGMPLTHLYGFVFLLLMAALFLFMGYHIYQKHGLENGAWFAYLFIILFMFAPFWMLKRFLAARHEDAWLAKLCTLGIFFNIRPAYYEVHSKKLSKSDNTVIFIPNAAIINILPVKYGSKLFGGTHYHVEIKLAEKDFLFAKSAIAKEGQRLVDLGYKTQWMRVDFPEDERNSEKNVISFSLADLELRRQSFIDELSRTYKVREWVKRPLTLEDFERILKAKYTKYNTA